MKGPSLVRVDDRLIHGQVIISWLPKIKCKKIIVVDDLVANDSYLSEVVHLAAPDGIAVNILSIEAALSQLDIFSDVLLLVKSPVTALELYKGGLSYDKLIIGGMGARSDRKTLYRNISASEDELAALDELSQLGVTPVYQVLSSDRAVPYKSKGKLGG